jgi:hypothetical protein
MPSVAHIKIVSLPKQSDNRLSMGIRLKRLSDLRKVLHSMAGTQEINDSTTINGVHPD